MNKKILKKFRVCLKIYIGLGEKRKKDKVLKIKRKKDSSQMWWHTHLIPKLGRQEAGRFL